MTEAERIEWNDFVEKANLKIIELDGHGDEKRNFIENTRRTMMANPNFYQSRIDRWWQSQRMLMKEPVNQYEMLYPSILGTRCRTFEAETEAEMQLAEDFDAAVKKHYEVANRTGCYGNYPRNIDGVSDEVFKHFRGILSELAEKHGVDFVRAMSVVALSRFEKRIELMDLLNKKLADGTIDKA